MVKTAPTWYTEDDKIRVFCGASTRPQGQPPKGCKHSLQEENYGKEFTKQEIVEKTGCKMAAVSGSITQFRNKHLIDVRSEEFLDEPETPTRKARYKTVYYITLNETGLTFDPVEENERIRRNKKH